jgi:hypothetical protein|tara:strand:- start:284 stop:712 length:429 start_codon:yes stop_codon:yes gene_type:complete
MGFKLGTSKGNYAVGGEIKTKLRFHRESGNPDLSVPGTPIIRKPLEEGVMGEANMDGSIYINEKLDPNSFETRQVITHEMRHATDIKTGKLSYADDHIMYNGEKFARETRNGKDMIKVDGRWKEAGHGGFPWEDDANNGIVK